MDGLALPAAKETLATEYDLHMFKNKLKYFIVMAYLWCAFDALQGPDGHPGDVGERGLPGADGDKVFGLVLI